MNTQTEDKTTVEILAGLSLVVAAIGIAVCLVLTEWVLGYGFLIAGWVGHYALLGVNKVIANG